MVWMLINKWSRISVSLFLLSLPIIFLSGCAGSRFRSSTDHSSVSVSGKIDSAQVETSHSSEILDAENPNEFSEDVTLDYEVADEDEKSLNSISFVSLNEPDSSESVYDLIALAGTMNPELTRLDHEIGAAQAKAHYVDQLPDPKIGANVFVNPIETAAGSQRSNLNFSQLIPWLGRLDAQQQKAVVEWLILKQERNVKLLQIQSDIRVIWAELYVIQKKITINNANEKLLVSLIEVANSRVSTGKSTQGDVLLGTLELSKIEEKNLVLHQQKISRMAQMNRLIGRDISQEVNIADELNNHKTDWSYETLIEMTLENQPAIASAYLKTQATRWGIEVAKLKRRPDISLNMNWYIVDNNRPTSTVVDVGEDAWSIGSQVSIPLWHKKYDMMEQEANRKHFAAYASVEEVTLKYSSLLRDFLEKARSAEDTANLYRNTILPQARQTLNSDQQSYINGVVEFDRVIRDFKTVLTLELEYHKALGQLYIAQARMQQVIGTELPIFLEAPALEGI